MKSSHHLARLEPLVLQALHGVPATDWHHAPEGKWTIAQIVQHLAISMDLVVNAFEVSPTGRRMRRRSRPYQRVLRHLVLGAGRLPGGLKAPQQAQPDRRPDPELVAAQFRMAVEQMRDLAQRWPSERQEVTFVRHPVYGDLNFPEWVRFHYLHCRHHGGQIRERLQWLGREERPGVS